MKLAYCGNRCDLCPKYLARTTNDDVKLRNVALLMQKAGWPHDLDNLDDNKCNGCQDIETCEYGLKECCLENNLRNCGECSRYPCDLVEHAFEVTQKNAELFKHRFNREEYEVMRKSFFLKKEYLDEIAQKQ